nr:hypothetical protein CFP56_70118 [Quercus suber]
MPCSPCYRLVGQYCSSRLITCTSAAQVGCAAAWMDTISSPSIPHGDIDAGVRLSLCSNWIARNWKRCIDDIRFCRWRDDG